MAVARVEKEKKVPIWVAVLGVVATFVFLALIRLAIRVYFVIQGMNG